VATFWTFRSCSECQGDQRPPDQQMQRIRVRNNDQLRGGPRRDPVAERLHAREQGTASLIQDEQPESLSQKQIQEWWIRSMRLTIHY